MHFNYYGRMFAQHLSCSPRSPAATPTPQGRSLIDVFGEFTLNVRESHRRRAGGGSPESLMLMSEAQVGAEPGREDTQEGLGGGRPWAGHPIVSGALPQGDPHMGRLAGLPELTGDAESPAHPCICRPGHTSLSLSSRNTTTIRDSQTPRRSDHRASLAACVFRTHLPCVHRPH